jgi:hypothetical protein
MKHRIRARNPLTDVPSRLVANLVHLVISPVTGAPGSTYTWGADDSPRCGRTMIQLRGSGVVRTPPPRSWEKEA